MKIDNFVIELEKQNPNGRYVHPIRESGYIIMDHIKQYLRTQNRSNLFIAHEYLKTLNKRINGRYSLRDIDELINCKLINEIEEFGLPF